MFKKNEINSVIKLVKKYSMKKYSENVTIKYIEYQSDYIVLEITLNLQEPITTRLLIDFNYLYDLESVYDYINLEISTEIKKQIRKYFYN